MFIHVRIFQAREREREKEREASISLRKIFFVVKRGEKREEKKGDSVHWSFYVS
jgi:hypothetical protein